MVETSENAKNSMEAACSESADKNPSDSSSVVAASAVLLQPGSKDKSKSLLKIQQDEDKSCKKEVPSANGQCDSSQENEQGSSASVNQTLKDSNVSSTSSESTEKSRSDKGSTDSALIVNGDKLKATARSASPKSSDTCALKSPNQDLNPEQGKEETIISDKSAVEVMPTAKSNVTATAEDTVKKPEIEEVVAPTVQADKSEVPENKSSSSNGRNAATDSDNKKLRSSV